MTLTGAVTLLVVAQAPAAADTVLLLQSTDDAWRPFEARLAAELQASGFEVHAKPAHLEASGDLPAQLFDECRREGAIAVLWFQARAEGRVDVWVADTVTSKAVLRTYPRPESGADRARLALRAVELLHASLLEVRLMPEEEQSDISEELKRFATRDLSQPHWVFGTGVGAIIAGSLRPQPTFELQVGYQFKPQIAVDLQVISSWFPAHVDSPRALYGADLGISMIRLQAEWTPLRSRSFSAGLVAGTGVALLWASGTTTLDGIEVHTDARATWLCNWGLGASVRLSEAIRLQVLGTVGLTFPEVGVTLAGTIAAWIGRPIIDALVRLEFE